MGVTFVVDKGRAGCYHVGQVNVWMRILARPGNRMEGTMEYRQLGKAGVRVSAIGLGTNRFGTDALPQKEVNNLIDAALDLGINHIDTANVYVGGRSEETLGEALKGRWDRFFVATKFVNPTGEGPNDRGASRYHIAHAVEASLRRLQSDHIDLYYVHRWDETRRSRRRCAPWTT